MIRKRRRKKKKKREMVRTLERASGRLGFDRRIRIPAQDAQAAGQAKLTDWRGSSLGRTGFRASLLAMPAGRKRKKCHSDRLDAGQTRISRTLQRAARATGGKRRWFRQELRQGRDGKQVRKRERGCLGREMRFTRASTQDRHR